MKRLTVAAAMLLAVAGCSGYQPKSGTVTSEKYTPAHTDLITTTSCSGSGSSFQCHPVITPYYYGDEWELCINSDTDFEDNGKPKHGCVDVDETTYHQYKVGDHYPKAVAS